eukprot:1154900-Pelagomonas_calceolata.AAC.1
MSTGTQFVMDQPMHPLNPWENRALFDRLRFSQSQITAANHHQPTPTAALLASSGAARYTAAVRAAASHLAHSRDVAFEMGWGCMCAEFCGNGKQCLMQLGAGAGA